ncbi:hypothetical protein D3C86_1368290 [compost metagenome]
MCWSTGRAPMPQPPGRETRASPKRATSGPSTRIDARMVFTSSYGASGALMSAAASVAVAPSMSARVPIWRSSLSIVRVSCRFGTLSMVMASAVSRLAHRIGSAAFLAPETRISPLSGPLPSIWNLSMLCRYSLCSVRRRDASRDGHQAAPDPAFHSAGVSVFIDSAWISARMRSPSAA